MSKEESVSVEVTKFDDFPDFRALFPSFTPDGVADGKVDSQFVDFTYNLKDAPIVKVEGYGDVNATGASVEQLDVKNAFFFPPGELSRHDTEILLDEDFDGDRDHRFSSEKIYDDDHLLRTNIEFNVPPVVPGEGDDGFDSFIANYEYNEQRDPIDIAVSVNSERSFADLEYFYDGEVRVSFRSQIIFGTAEEPNFLAELFQYNEQGDLVFYTSTLNGVLREQTFEYDYSQETKIIQTTTVDPSQFGVNFDLKKLIYDEDDTLFRKELGLAPVLHGSDEGWSPLLFTSMMSRVR